MVIVIGKEDLLMNDEIWSSLIQECKNNKTYNHANIPTEEE